MLIGKGNHPSHGFEYLDIFRKVHWINPDQNDQPVIQIEEEIVLSSGQYKIIDKIIDKVIENINKHPRYNKSYSKQLEDIHSRIQERTFKKRLPADIEKVNQFNQFNKYMEQIIEFVKEIKIENIDELDGLLKNLLSVRSQIGHMYNLNIEMLFDVQL